MLVRLPYSYSSAQMLSTSHHHTGCTTGPTGNVSILDVPLPFSTWSCDYIPPSFPNFTVTSSDSSVLSLWILLNAFKNDNTFIKNSNLVTQLQFTPPLLLTPNGSVDVVYTAMQFTFGKNVWMGLTAGTWSRSNFCLRPFKLFINRVHVPQ